MRTIAMPLILIAFLCCHTAQAEGARTIDAVHAQEIRSLGYKNKGELISRFTTCSIISSEIIERSICAAYNDSCIRSQPRWIANNCDYHSTAIYLLLSEEQDAADRLFSDLPDAKQTKKKK